MATIQETAKEISSLAPKVMAGMKGNLMFSEDITPQQMITIMTLNQFGKSMICALSKRMGVAPPTTTGLIDRLERSGYVGRSRDAKDRRIVFVQLTKKGQKFVDKLKKTIENKWSKILTHLTADERATIVKIFRKINDALSKESR